MPIDRDPTDPAKVTPDAGNPFAPEGDRTDPSRVDVVNPFAREGDRTDPSRVEAVNPFTPEGERTDPSRVDVVNPFAPEGERTDPSRVDVVNPFAPEGDRTGPSRFDLVRTFAREGDRTDPSRDDVLNPLEGEAHRSPRPKSNPLVQASGVAAAPGSKEAPSPPATPPRGLLPPVPASLRARLAEPPGRSEPSPPVMAARSNTFGPLPIPAPPPDLMARAADEDLEASGARLRDSAAEEFSSSGVRMRRRSAGHPHGPSAGDARDEKSAASSRRAARSDASEDDESSEYSGAAMRDASAAEYSISGARRSPPRGRNVSAASGARVGGVSEHVAVHDEDAAPPDVPHEVASGGARRRMLRAPTMPSAPPLRARLGTRRRHVAAVIAGILIGVALAGLVVQLRREPAALTGVPLTRSFGTAADVDFRSPEGKTFRYGAASSAPVISVLHYRADGLVPGALTLRLNGELLAEVEPAADDSALRQRVRVLPADLLARETPARIAFVPGLPGARWRIEDLWIEEVPVPSDAEAAHAESRRYAARGREALNRSVASPAALFEAWQAFRRAWIVLEPVQPRPAVYAELRAKYDAITESLDAQCSAMLLAAERSLRQQDDRGARESLAAVQRYFPTGEHHCHNRALVLTAEHGL